MLSPPCAALAEIVPEKYTFSGKWRYATINHAGSEVQGYGLAAAQGRTEKAVAMRGDMALTL